MFVAVEAAGQADAPATTIGKTASVFTTVTAAGYCIASVVVGGRILWLR
jgi:hypothetical protein